MEDLVKAVISCDAPLLGQILQRETLPRGLDFYISGQAPQETPLHRALQFGSNGLNLSRLLLRHSASVHPRRYQDNLKQSSFSATCLAVALVALTRETHELDNSRGEKLIKLLLESNADPNESTASLARMHRISVDETSPLAIGAKLGSPTILSMLLGCGADVNRRTNFIRLNHVGMRVEQSETPLHVALRTGTPRRLECVQLLLDSNAHLDSPRREETTVYQWDYIASGEDNIVKKTVLLPIHLAVQTSDPELVFLLCAYRANPSAKALLDGKFCGTTDLIGSYLSSNRREAIIDSLGCPVWSPDVHRLYPRAVREYYQTCFMYLCSLSPPLPTEIIIMILRRVTPN